MPDKPPQLLLPPAPEVEMGVDYGNMPSIAITEIWNRKTGRRVAWRVGEEPWEFDREALNA
jgi:hypothetical protein